MFVLCKWILIYNTVVLLLYSDTVCATNAKEVEKLAGVVENITVQVLEDKSYLKNDNVLESLKLNVSWIPPSGGKQPYSYSIMITSILRETDINKTECIEGSALYNVQNKGQFSILIPQNKLLNGMSEVQIHPNCMYKIHVYANPRAKPTGKLPEVIYTVPKCIGHKCSCADAKSILPTPKVEAIRTKESIVVNWNITSNSSDICSYVISVGIPLLISKAGQSVYNITKISNVTSATNTFSWDMRVDGQYIKVKNKYKILIAAMDCRGCLGTQGFAVINASETKILNRSTMWLLFVGVVICIVLGFIGIMSIHNKNGYRFVLTTRRRQTGSCKLRRQWPDLVFQRRNIMYVNRFEEPFYSIHKDEFEVPYKYLNLIRELGKGQFGKVYLGKLNNESTLIAVKMDAHNGPEAQHQLLEEIKIMKAAGPHTHLVTFIGCCTLPDNPTCILLEYMEGGDLLAYLHRRRNIKSNDMSLCSFENAVSRYADIIEGNKNDYKHPYDTIETQQLIKFAFDIASGMEHLEAKRIVHRDLAARNILLTSDLTLKISDFGLSRSGTYVIHNMSDKIRQLPIRWMSPEAIRDRAFSSKNDVWSFGVVLWEIGTLGSFPYSSIQDNKLLHYLTQSECRLTCPDTISQDIYNIMCSCWNTAPQDRPSFAQLVSDLEALKKPLHFMHETSNPCYGLLSH
ncbi:PREDICTED: platelet-derived growth factor receptor alpha [Vollenhovia emeryi]|uniref:platelet-derived growth factor receptor alpha n=1 Tax=Vollenhovia emeryi TaxID=411798 RepID=UPI0005F41940|nr:PREDICTED: platelet-derived growth factor receptor alpha [Vollenhovia emeryi]